MGMTLTEFKKFADENNIVPVSSEIYSKMINDSFKYDKIKQILAEAKDSNGDIKFNWFYQQIKKVVEDGVEQREAPL